MSKKRIIILIAVILIILVAIASRYYRPVWSGYCGIGDDLRAGKDFKNCICIGKKDVDNLWEKGGYGAEIKCKGLMFGIIAR